MATALLERIKAIDPDGKMVGRVLFKRYQEAVGDTKEPTGWWIKKHCPKCDSRVVSKVIAEIEDGPMSLTTHWCFIYYQCPNCDYEYGKWS